MGLWVIPAITQDTQSPAPRPSQILSHASLMPTSSLGLPAAGPLSASGQGTVPLDQALPQLLDLAGQPLYQREAGGLGHLPLEVLQNAHRHTTSRDRDSQTQLLLHRLELHSRVRSGVGPRSDTRAQLSAELLDPVRLLGHHLTESAGRVLEGGGGRGGIGHVRGQRTWASCVRECSAACSWLTMPSLSLRMLLCLSSLSCCCRWTFLQASHTCSSSKARPRTSTSRL
ncbi:hypothetical protein EYF80_015065 [Liparis tanakae]|uniref:Uncharacterized protein n=1 Tax=Liparis tanakae TaxID=230148 RepID=A0A4Z2I9X2_9TELE|nr:hypothetical protein EYF80_015065 [Liparis tanakae]